MKAAVAVGWLAPPGCLPAAAPPLILCLIGVISEKLNTFTSAGLPGPGAVTMLLRPDMKSTKPELTLTPDRSSAYGLNVEKMAGAVPGDDGSCGCSSLFLLMNVHSSTE